MRRASLCIFACILFVSLMTGCGVQASKNESIRIGITQIVEHPALNSVKEGILEGLAKHGFREQLDVDYQIAQGDIQNAATIANQFVAEQKDMIIAIATTTAQAAAQATKEIPIVFATVTDPVAAGLVKSLNETTGNITGTSDQLPMELQIDLITQFLPDVKTIGVIYTTSEVNSNVQVEAIEKAAEGKGISIEKVGITHSAEVRAATESIVGKVDAILIPIDNTVVSAAEGVLFVGKKAKVPVFASDTDTVKRGAIATYGIDYYQMGVQTGEMAARILQGEKISDNPVEITKQTDLIINLAAAAEFGLKVSDDLKKKAKELIE